MNPSPLHSHPDKTLEVHLREVETAGRLILARHPESAFSRLGLNAEQVIWALAGWHDIAKATAFFQDYIKDTAGFKRRSQTGDPLARPELKTHTPLGSLLALNHWAGKGQQLVQPHSDGAEIDGLLAALLVALAVRGHHSGLPSQGKLRGTVQQQELPDQLQRLSVAVESCHPSLTGTVAPLLALGFEELQGQALELLDDAFTLLEKCPLERRLRYRLTVQFCFSCLLEADKGLLIHKDLAEYIGRPGMVMPGHRRGGASAPEFQRPPH